jgi:arylsulfatase A-like enzyme
MWVLLVLLPMYFSACEQASRPPNFVVIFMDDMGYGDLGCYGNVVHRTPNIDRMAAEGMRFTDFYVTSGVCTPSRSSLMTGCYPRRVDMHVNARPPGSVGRQVLFPVAEKGLDPEEVTIAEALRAVGYATACVGKWHLGDQEPFLPTRQGFDYYFGIPYSNDMDRPYCPLPLMRNEEVIEAPVDQSTITRRYTEEAIDFIVDNRDRPFFLYLPHTMVHNPLYASESFRGKSKNGAYGDAVEEVDWSTGAIMDCLKDLKIDRQTLIVFLSDNGAASRWGGTNRPLSGWKGSTMEGGMRIPAIFWWPETVPPSEIRTTPATTMDILPTFCALSGAEVPDDRIIDGHDISEMIKGHVAEQPREPFYYYQLEQLQAVRSGRWKLHLPLDSMLINIHRGNWGAGRTLKLIDLENDIAEAHDVSVLHPEVVNRLLDYAEQARADLGDLHIQGAGTRQAALVEDPRCQLASGGK